MDAPAAEGVQVDEDTRTGGVDESRAALVEHYLRAVPLPGDCTSRDLVRRAVEETDHVVTSIFVNPIQFGPGEDLGRYPSTPDVDVALLGSLGCRTAYVPPVEEMYPEGFCTRVGMTGLTDALCGATRPGHFSGVLTVVLKLLQQARPDRAYFGQKDYQQFRVIDRMVRDLDVPAALVYSPAGERLNGRATCRDALLTPADAAAAKDSMLAGG